MFTITNKYIKLIYFYAFFICLEYIYVIFFDFDHFLKPYRLIAILMLFILLASKDVFVAPSIEENLANTVLESLACGTPAIAFNIGGMPDAIGHKINGYLARPFDTNNLWYGIKYILNNGNKLMRQQARMKVLKNFDIRKQNKKYENLCNSISVT